MTVTGCRCERDTPVHLCHGARYTCPAPATERLDRVRLAPLAGVQTKLIAMSTWACDDHWDEYLRQP